MSETNSTALDGIRVLDLSRILAGPWASQMLADFGADVIKIERPDKGDDTRGWGPPWLATEQGEETEESAYFSCANRGKRSLTIDITHPEGQAIVRQLAQQSDIFLENFKVDGLKKYGLDYANLKALNPRLIYCSITGFGQDGPFKHRAGYDFMIQGMAGLMSVTGVPDGEAGAGPQKVGVALADIITGLYACNACLAALHFREVSGKGQHIDLSLLDVQVAALANQAANYLVSGNIPTRLGNAHPNIVPYQSFASADGYFILAVGNDSQFSRLCELLAHSEWASEHAFLTNAKRVARREELIPLLEAEFIKQSTSYWLQNFERLGIPCGPINTIDQVFANDQVKARGLLQTVAHPTADTVKLVSNPVKFSESPLASMTAPPLLGEHTADVLKEVLDMDKEEIEKLRDEGVVS